MPDKYPYQVAVDKINEIGIYTARQGQKPYNILHKLAKSLNVYMHGSQSFIGKYFNIPPQKMNKKAANALRQYCEQGVLQIPNEFKYNDKREYRHDGDANANRNVWKESNSARHDLSRKKPVQYRFNTLKR